MFKGRQEVGEKLAEALKEGLSGQAKSSALILAIPRGGIIVGEKISKILAIPMDCLIIKKIPAPGNEELAIGALGEGGTVIWEEELCQRLGVSSEYRTEIVKQKLQELEAKKEFFRKGKPLPEIKDKTVILIDDGIATGATMKTAIKIVRSFKPAQIIVAVPVIAKDTLPEIKQEVEQVVYLEAPEMFFAVGQFYENFEPVSDEKVLSILNLQ